MLGATPVGVLGRVGGRSTVMAPNDAEIH
jgi:hypothetical protein